MRVLMLAPGTLGDVAAPAGLGARLQAAGHDVTIVADALYAHMAADASCMFQPVPAELRQLIAASATGPRRQAPRRLRALLRAMTPVLRARCHDRAAGSAGSRRRAGQRRRDRRPGLHLDG
jgi:UDP:flavonoid glycosyltransferase YjiC (YdhE family)